MHCFFKNKNAVPPAQPSSCINHLHKHTTRILLLRLRIKHLTLRTQPIALRHQVIDLLPALQHTLNRLMQHDLRLIQLLLDLHYTIRLLRILILDDIVLKFGKGEGRVGIGPGGARVLG